MRRVVFRRRRRFLPLSDPRLRAIGGLRDVGLADALAGAEVHQESRVGEPIGKA